MSTTTNDATTARPGRPAVVDPATWQAARDELLIREKAHTGEGDAIWCPQWTRPGATPVPPPEEP